jgi:hypothetical protein
VCQRVVDDVQCHSVLRSECLNPDPFRSGRTSLDEGQHRVRRRMRVEPQIVAGWFEADAGRTARRRTG